MNLQSPLLPTVSSPRARRGEAAVVAQYIQDITHSLPAQRAAAA